MMFDRRKLQSPARRPRLHLRHRALTRREAHFHDRARVRAGAECLARRREDRHAVGLTGTRARRVRLGALGSPSIRKARCKSATLTDSVSRSSSPWRRRRLASPKSHGAHVTIVRKLGSCGAEESCERIRMMARAGSRPPSIAARKKVEKRLDRFRGPKWLALRSHLKIVFM